MLRSEVRGALIDAHVASYNKELFEHPLLRLNKIYDSNKAYGVVLGGPTKKIQKCLVQYLSENRAWASAHIKANSRPYTVRIQHRGYYLGREGREEGKFPHAR